uniref:Uncharacterized protein n=1 Tax=Salvator merianae TaxID=96440 RepID=A0A8D0EBU0_SALMN
KKSKQVLKDHSLIEFTSQITAAEVSSEFKDIEGTDVKDKRLKAEAVMNHVSFAMNVEYINVETWGRNRCCQEVTGSGSWLWF